MIKPYENFQHHPPHPPPKMLCQSALFREHFSQNKNQQKKTILIYIIKMHEFDRDEIKINCLGKMLFWRKAFNFIAICIHKVIQFCAKLNEEVPRGIMKIKLSSHFC